MKLVKSILVAGATTAVLAGAAVAADPIMPVPVVPVAPVASGFDWNGFYAGVGVGGAFLSNPPATSTHTLLNVVVGGNIVADSFLFGLEGSAGGYWLSGGGSGWNATASARAGVLVDPNVLVYGALSATAYSAGARYGSVGGGVEFAVSDNVSLDVEYKYHAWSNNGWNGHVIGAQALFHF